MKVGVRTWEGDLAADLFGGGDWGVVVGHGGVRRCGGVERGMWCARLGGLMGGKVNGICNFGAEYGYWSFGVWVGGGGGVGGY